MTVFTCHWLLFFPWFLLVPKIAAVLTKPVCISLRQQNDLFFCGLLHVELLYILFCHGFSSLGYALSLSIFSFWGRLQESYSCRRLHILGQQTPSLKMLSLASHLCTIWEGLGVWPELQHLESIWSQAKPNKAAEETHKNTNATPQVQSDDSGFKNNRVATLSCGWKVSVGSTKIQSPRHIHQNPSRHCH